MKSLVCKRIFTISGLLLSSITISLAQQKPAPVQPSPVLNSSVADAPKPLSLPKEGQKGRAGEGKTKANDWRSTWQAEWLRKQEKREQGTGDRGQDKAEGENNPNTQHLTPHAALSIENPKSKIQNSPNPQSLIPNPSIAGVTKPDMGTPITAAKLNTLDSPTAALGGSGKMYWFLLPMLAVTWGALKLLQRYQQQTGRLPRALQNAGRTQAVKPQKTGGFLGALLGGFNLNTARERGGSNIRVVESVPVGGVNIHLVEVRGKLLLLGASGGAVNLLTEFQQEEIDGSDFRALLNAAASEMNDLSDDDALPAAAVVGSLEDELRDTGDSLQKRLRRLRTVQEAEADPDCMRFDNAR